MQTDLTRKNLSRTYPSLGDPWGRTEHLDLMLKIVSPTWPILLWPNSVVALVVRLQAKPGAV